MRVPGAAAGLVVFLGLSGGVFGVDCEVPKGHTDPEIISPVGHEPTAGKICLVAANYEVVVRRCELRYCCGFRCTCDGAVHPSRTDCQGLFSRLSCYVENRETHSSIKVCCSGYEENDHSVCIKVDPPQPPVTTSTVSQETSTASTTTLSSVSPERLTKPTTSSTKPPASTYPTAGASTHPTTGVGASTHPTAGASTHPTIGVGASTHPTAGATGATAGTESGSGPRLSIPLIDLVLMAAVICAVILLLAVVIVVCFLRRRRRRPGLPPALARSSVQDNIYQIEMSSTGTGRNTSTLESGRTSTAPVHSGRRTTTASPAGQVDTSEYLDPVETHIYEEID